LPSGIRSANREVPGLAQVREREILRVHGTLHGNAQSDSMKRACDEVLRWAQTKAVGKFESAAWNHQSFEQVASGRSRVAVRVDEGESSIWAIRVEDPDREIAGRIWTTEIVLASHAGRGTTFTVRQLVGSPELTLVDVEPHVPGIVRQIIKSPGLAAGIFRLTDQPLTVSSEKETSLLIDALLDPSRTLPIIVASVPAGSTQLDKPFINTVELAKACAGLAIVIVLPARFTWQLTERFGKRLSVYEGAVRIYLQGFTEDANPFGGHDLILADRLGSEEGLSTTLKRLRWMAALGSVTRLKLGTDVPVFASIRLKNLEYQQLQLQRAGASDQEQLNASRKRIETLVSQVEEAERYQQQFSDLYDQSEERAKAAESQVLASGYRIQQLIEQLKEAGKTPDENIPLPNTWADFADWCDSNLAGRVMLTPQARRALRTSVFEDIELAARCLLWLANDLRMAKESGGEGTLRDRVIEPGIVNAHCGSDTFEIEWQSGNHDVDWHIKNGGNTRDRQRCLRIYYFWDSNSQQAVIASMPEHRRTDAS
jgi:hypothetical protein